LASSRLALLIDYVLTIATSVASANDAMFSILQTTAGMEVCGRNRRSHFMTVLNLRGVRESVMVLFRFLSFSC